MENLKNKYDSVKATDLQAQLQTADKPTVIDIRNGEMFGDMHIAGSVNIPEEELPERLAELPKDREAPLVMVCNIGKFSKRSVLYLKSLGYRNVRSMKGGLNEWVRKGHSTESTQVSAP